MTIQDEQVILLTKNLDKEKDYRESLAIVYGILMDQWENIPEEEREAVDKKLKALGL